MCAYGRVFGGDTDHGFIIHIKRLIINEKATFYIINFFG
jgi:hypothetical protein